MEIKDAVGADNIKIFGLTAHETADFYMHGGYNASATAAEDPRLTLLLQQLVNGFFKSTGKDFWGIYDAMLRHNDEYFVLKDFGPYVQAWKELTALHKDKSAWNGISLVNIAMSGYFSSDRTIAEYAKDIWKI